MLIALDIDGTYTRDHQMWNQFIDTAKERGHKIIAVTWRYPAELNDKAADILGKYVTIHCTSRKQKRAYMASKGIFPDIWIDDMPEAIV